LSHTTSSNSTRVEIDSDGDIVAVQWRELNQTDDVPAMSGQSLMNSDWLTKTSRILGFPTKISSIDMTNCRHLGIRLTFRPNLSQNEIT
jgi:hypothetical protein